jgi:uncharacterized membrane protein
MAVRYIQGLDYTLIVTTAHSQGIDRSTVQVQDLTGKVFDVWKRRYRLWRHPIHGTAKTIVDIKEIYNAMDVDEYVKENRDE